MAFEKDVVNVIVSLGGRPITTAGFETPMFVAQHAVFPERVRRYTSVDGVVADGFAVGSPVHQFVTTLFAGNFAPRAVVIGRRSLTSHTVTPNVAEDETEYSITIKIDGTTESYTYTSEVGDTLADIAAGLHTLVAAGVAATAGTITATYTPLDSDFSIALGTGTKLSVGWTTKNVTVSSDSAETIGDALTAIADVDSDWYFMSEDSHDNTEMQAIASYAASVDKHYVYSTQEADVLVAGNETNIAHLLRESQYEGCTGMYSSEADNIFPEGGIIGAWSGTNPGTSTLHGKTLEGVPVDNITESQKETLKVNNLNYYVFTYGVGFFFNGETASGYFADQVRLKHWTQARVAEEVFNVIKRESDLGRKVEMGPVGFAKVRQAISSILDLGIRRGAFLDNPAYVISIPTREEIPETLRNQRILPDVAFTVTSSGAVHSVEIRGYIVS